jgi:hypothetical protein
MRDTMSISSPNAGMSAETWSVLLELWTKVNLEHKHVRIRVSTDVRGYTHFYPALSSRVSWK